MKWFCSESFPHKDISIQLSVLSLMITTVSKLLEVADNFERNVFLRVPPTLHCQHVRHQMRARAVATYTKCFVSDIAYIVDILTVFTCRDCPAQRRINIGSKKLDNVIAVFLFTSVQVFGNVGNKAFG